MHKAGQFLPLDFSPKACRAALEDSLRDLQVALALCCLTCCVAPWQEHQPSGYQRSGYFRGASLQQVRAQVAGRTVSAQVTGASPGSYVWPEAHASAAADRRGSGLGSLAAAGWHAWQACPLLLLGVVPAGWHATCALSDNLLFIYYLFI